MKRRQTMSQQSFQDRSPLLPLQLSGHIDPSCGSGLRAVRLNGWWMCNAFTPACWSISPMFHWVRLKACNDRTASLEPCWCCGLTGLRHRCNRLSKTHTHTLTHSQWFNSHFSCEPVVLLILPSVVPKPGLASFCQWPVKTGFFRGKNRPGKN